MFHLSGHTEGHAHQCAGGDGRNVVLPGAMVEKVCKPHCADDVRPPLVQWVDMVLPGGDRVPCRLNLHIRGQGRTSGNWPAVQDALGLNHPDQVRPVPPWALCA